MDKAQEIAGLKKQMEKDFQTGNWKRYNKACDRIGELNRNERVHVEEIAGQYHVIVDGKAAAIVKRWGEVYITVKNIKKNLNID